jgi:uncharacterized protein YdeI (YjbR/CyaY-like superfamily)
MISGVTDTDFTSAYIAKAQPFAQPVLRHLRQLILAQSPRIDEASKWSAPAFVYKGTIVCMMAAFKAHVTFGFWYGRMVTGGTGVENAAMGSFGRIASLADLPSDAELARMVANSLDLIDRGVKPPQFENKKPPKPPAETPPSLANAIAENADASLVWDSFGPGARREYCEWIDDAKRDETRDKRVAQAVAWIAEGKKRNWKYENC